MIIGSGILADAFKRSGFDQSDLVIIAAGVSNSLEDRQSEFEREEALLRSIHADGKRVVYFSTVSIYDKLKKDSKYVQHKLKMEDMIPQLFKKTLIMSLPIVVSRKNNPNQLFGYIRSKIKNREKLMVYRKASRYLFDVDEVPKACETLLSYCTKEGIDHLNINVGFDPAIKLEDLASYLKGKLNAFDFQMVDEGDSYTVDFSLFKEIGKAEGINFRSQDPYNLIDDFIATLEQE